MLDYIYFKKYYLMIAVDLINQQAPDAVSKSIQQINFTGNLNRGEDVNVSKIMFFDIKEVKEIILGFSPGNAKALGIYFTLL